MVRTERFLADRERSLVERLSIGVTTLRSVQLSQVVERCRDIGMVGTERFLPDPQRTLCQRCGFGEFTGLV
jgi:hypothetical protein